MRVAASQEIAGVPIRRVRDFLRKLDFGWTTGAEVCARLGAESDEILSALKQRGYLEAAEKPGHYKAGPRASTLANAKFIKPITRQRAEVMVAEMLDRVDAINADDRYLMAVESVFVFGSYVESRRETLGDIDLCVSTKWRRGRPTNEERRTHAGDRSFSTYLGFLFWPHQEVLLAVKARKPHISLHVETDLKAVKPKPVQIYPRTK